MKKLLLALGLVLVIALCCFFAFRVFHQDPPAQFWSVSYSSDGKTIYTVGGPDDQKKRPQFGELLFWDAATGKTRQTTRYPWGVRRVVSSGNGKYLGICDFGGTTKLLDARTAKTIGNLTPHSGLVNALTISQDGNLIAGGGFDGVITLWDSTGKEVATPIILPGTQILSLATSPDGQKLVAGCRGTAYLFDLLQKSPPKPVEAYRGDPNSYWRGIEGVAFGPDGKTFATGGVLVRLWDATEGNLIRDFPAGAQRVNALAFSPNGETLAGVDREGYLRLWDTTSGSQRTVTQAHKGPCFALAYSPDGRYIATTGRADWALKIWDAQTLKLIKTAYRAKAT
jgi:WD40 repeat protein